MEVMMSVGRDSTGRFGAGNPGRPRGSRNRRPVDETVWRALASVLNEDDLAEQLRVLRERDPVAFLRLCVDFTRPAFVPETMM